MNDEEVALKVKLAAEGLASAVANASALGLSVEFEILAEYCCSITGRKKPVFKVNVSRPL